jgi:hypothetical protein
MSTPPSAVIERFQLFYRFLAHAEQPGLAPRDPEMSLTIANPCKSSDMKDSL